MRPALQCAGPLANHVVAHLLAESLQPNGTSPWSTTSLAPASSATPIRPEPVPCTSRQRAEADPVEGPPIDHAPQAVVGAAGLVLQDVDEAGAEMQMLHRPVGLSVN
jgi:hypothetical protein